MKKSEITKDFLLEQLKKHLLYENDVDWNDVGADCIHSINIYGV